MTHYVTLFDAGFLPQGLALQRSLERHGGAHTLWILCLDGAAHSVLSSLALPNVRLLELAKVETAELNGVKPGRSRAEYCWTLTPFAPRFVFDADPSVDAVTYVDADLWFRASPQALHDELAQSGKSVLITDHAYAPEYDQSHRTGQYCVQFVTFRRDGGEIVRAWWAAKCIEWCFARAEPGRFGDQKYLDVWPTLFADRVHVASRLDAILAPWNAKRFPPSSALAYHFHGLRTMCRDRIMLTDHYDLPMSTIEVIYKPYLDELRTAFALLRGVGHEPVAQTRSGPWKVRARALALRGRQAWLRWRRPDVVRLG